MKKETVPIPPQTPEDYVRFWSKVRVVGSEECWEWQATKMPNGYGQFSFKGRHVYAHRVAWAWAFGNSDPGPQSIDHLCRNHLCVNPRHLEAVSQRDNLLRGETLPAAQLERTHCPQGHPYSGDNLYLRPDRPGRGCLACRHEASR